MNTIVPELTTYAVYLYGLWQFDLEPNTRYATRQQKDRKTETSTTSKRLVSKAYVSRLVLGPKR